MYETTEAALRFILAIADGIPTGETGTLQIIRNTLEDGQTLRQLGITDADTEMVEVAHDYIKQKQAEGFTELDDVIKHVNSRPF